MENRYARYGLTANPFPEVAIANRDSPGPFISFAEDFMSRLSFLVESSIEQKAWGGIPLVGTVGSGKSRLLFEIYKKYRESKQVKFIFIENPGLSLKNLFAAVIEDVLRDSSVLVFLFRRYEDTLLEVIQKNSQKTLVYPSKLVVDLSQREIIYGALANLLNEEVFLDESLGRCFAIILAYEIISKNEYFKDKVIFIGSNEGLFQDYTLAKEFLKGGRLPRSASTHLKCQAQEIGEKEIINFGIKSVIRLYKLLEHKMIFLLIDQFERIIEHLPTRTMLGLLDGYRSLIDKNLENFSAIFACTTEAWFESAKAYPSFKERFTDPLEIPKVTFETAKKIVVAYCETARISREYRGSSFPFGDDAVSRILEKSATIRDFLESCHMILFRASLKAIPKIEEANIDQLL